MTIEIRIRDLDTGAVIHTIPTGISPGTRSWEKFMSGMERKVDSTRFYIDDTDADARGES